MGSSVTFFNAFLVFCMFVITINGYYYGGNYNHKHRHNKVYNCVNGICYKNRGPPTCLKWCLVYFTNGLCDEARFKCCSYREKPGFCPQNNMFCNWPMPYYVTEPYQCFNDFNCPSGQKCCEDSCFAHKICKTYFYFRGQDPEYSTAESVEKTDPTTTVRSTEVSESTATITIMTTAATETKFETITTTEGKTTSGTDATTTVEDKTTVTETETTLSETPSTASEPETTTLITGEVTTASTEASSTVISPDSSPQTTINGDTTIVSIETTTIEETTVVTTFSPTIEDFDENGSGSGDDENGSIPNPEAARLVLPNDFYDTFADDEDAIKILFN